MLSDWLVVRDCSFSLSAPWSPLSVPTILSGLLLPWTRDLLSRLLQHILCYWGFSDFGRGLSPHGWSSEGQLPLLTLNMGYKVMLKILQVNLQQYLNHELPDVQSGFRKGRGMRYQIANILWIINKAREFQKNIFLLYWLCLWLCGSK